MIFIGCNFLLKEIVMIDLIFSPYVLEGLLILIVLFFIVFVLVFCHVYDREQYISQLKRQAEKNRRLYGRTLF